MTDTQSEQSHGESSQSTPLSKDIVATLLHDSIVANNQIPQASYAQAITIADDITQLITGRRITFVKEIADLKLDDNMLQALDEAKIKGHTAHGFETVPISGLPDHPMRIIWEGDKQFAFQLLSVVCKLAYSSETKLVFFGQDMAIVEHVLFHPDRYDVDGIAAMIHTAREELISDDTKQLTKEYRDIISAYMQKYAGYTFVNRPATYNQDTEVMNAKKDALLQEVLERVKAAMDRKAPDSIKQDFIKMSTKELFNGIASGFISPLVDPAQSDQNSDEKAG